MSNFLIEGNLVDIENKSIQYGSISVEGGKIVSINYISEQKETAPFILPGFIDSHVHVESSMLIPSEFARLATLHGTVATISDPHEIANVCGMDGVEFMINNGKQVPFKFYFGAPSCVPATVFETAGATLNAADVALLLKRPEVKYLSEMMNFPGVLYKDPEVMEKIAAAHAVGKPVDGHAPGLRGDLVQQYIDAGISTDHECFTFEEALDKLQRGMKIIIREGSAAKNFEALVPLLNEWPEQMMFCSDDKHPDSLAVGHINELCARAVAKGIDVFKVLQAACVNPVKHYNLEVGTLKNGDYADFIVVNDLISFNVKQTYIDGQLLAENGKNINDSWYEIKSPIQINQFNCDLKTVEQFAVDYKNELTIPVIEALDGQLITNRIDWTPKVADGKIIGSLGDDVLKIVVVNRYHNAPIAISFVKNFGLKEGAIASSVAHDSHNIIAVGVDDESICKAVNLTIEATGAVSAVSKTTNLVLALPVAGLMSDKNGFEIAKAYTEIDLLAKEMGSSLSAPFMTLSFLALLVIPHLKLSDKGLFDGDKFEFI